MEMGKTEGVKILTGEPEKALVRLSIPMMISNLTFTLYNFADGAWVSGLGAEALSAIGIFLPIFMMFMSLSMGLGVGAGSAVSRRIGAEDKSGADNTAVHAYLMALAIGFVITLSYLKLEDILSLIGAEGAVLDLALTYSRIIILGSIFLVFINVSFGILNGEGNAKRAMYANVSGLLLNILLDPILIYALNLGIAGAAYASVISMIFSSLLVLYWTFFNSKTYVDPYLSKFSLNRAIVYDILRVGIPSAFSMLAMSLSLVFLNAMIVKVSSQDGIAVFTSAWRIVQFGFIPLFGFASAETAVIGSAFGDRNINKLERAYRYGIKTGVKIEIMLVAFFILLSPYLALFFTYSENSARIYDMLVETMRVFPIFLVFTPFGILTVSLFQGIGKGERGLAITLLRTFIFQLTLAFLLGFLLNLSFRGILYGIVAGNILASLVAFAWGMKTISHLKSVYGYRY